jgi:hypothetical protein
MKMRKQGSEAREQSVKKVGTKRELLSEPPFCYVHPSLNHILHAA